MTTETPPNDGSVPTLPDLPPVVRSQTADGFVPSAARRRSFASFRTIAALMLREMSTRYGRSPGGYVWSVMEPIAAVCVLAVGFSLLLRSPSLGSNFFLFFTTGYIPFYIYQQISRVTSRSISFSRPLLNYPAVSWIDSVIARFVLNALTSIMVSYLTFVIVLMTQETRTVFEIGPVFSAVVLALLLGFGVGLVNCTLNGLYPTWEIIWSIVTRPLFIASGVIFIYEDLPQLAQKILWFNPLMHITGIFREGIYPQYEPQYVSVVFTLGISLGLSALGLMLLRRYHRVILEKS